MAELAKTDRAPGNTDGAPKKGDSDEDFLASAVKRFNRAAAKEVINRQMAVDDLKFKAGDQWPAQVKAQRTIERRPCLTINKMKTFVHQITNDQRQNRPSINISPVGDQGDPETAKMLKGLIKQIERQSHADVAYDTGFDSAVSIGWGYWRILTQYEKEDSFDQVLLVSRIRNPFRVYLDPDHEEPDGSDAKWAFISDLIPRSEFRQMYPKATIADWNEGGMGDETNEWGNSTHIRLAEYFYIETTMRKLVKLDTGHVGFKEDLAPEVLERIKAFPEMVVEERESECNKVLWCKHTSNEVLERGEWAGQWIPIVKIIGDEVDIEGEVTLAGIVRDAKDPQRMYNFWCTSETELIALAPKAPWVMEEGQIDGHEQRWKEANNKSLPYLLYKGVNLAGKPAPPPQRQQFAGPPTGVVQAKMAAAQDMMATTGIRFDATLSERMADESGRALEQLKRVGDLGSYHYVDNLSRSLKHTGRILVDLIPKIYDTRRILTILREDGEEELAIIDPQLPKAYAKTKTEDGGADRIYNPKLGRYDVTVTVGPSYATRRVEAADSMMAFMKVVPQSGPLIGDLIAKNMDWPGAEEIAERLASMLPPQLLNKRMEQLPPEARALVSSLMQQMEQLKQEHDQALQLLGDKEKDREIDRAKVMNEKESIDKDFVIDNKKISADVMTKMAAIQGNMEDRNSGQVGMAKVVADYEAKLAKIEADQSAKMADLQIQIMLRDAELRTKLMEKTMDLDAKRPDGQIETLNKKISEMDARMNDMNEIEIVFERDPKTNRIAKARKAKRAVQ